MGANAQPDTRKRGQRGSRHSLLEGRYGMGNQQGSEEYTSQRPSKPPGFNWGYKVACECASQAMMGVRRSAFPLTSAARSRRAAQNTVGPTVRCIPPRINRAPAVYRHPEFRHGLFSQSGVSEINAALWTVHETLKLSHRRGRSDEL